LCLPINKEGEGKEVPRRKPLSAKTGKKGRKEDTLRALPLCEGKKREEDVVRNNDAINDLRKKRGESSRARIPLSMIGRGKRSIPSFRFAAW